MPRLRPVAPDERAHKKMTIIEAADHGSHEDLLRALKSRLAVAIQDSSAHPRDIAALSLRLAVVSEELEALAMAAAVAGDDPVSVAARIPDEPFDGSAV